MLFDIVNKDTSNAFLARLSPWAMPEFGPVWSRAKSEMTTNDDISRHKTNVFVCYQ
jgi:hypothetical protein